MSRWRLLHAGSAPDRLVRRLAAITFINTFGNGLLLTAGVLYYTRIIDLSPVAVGTGLIFSGVCGMAGSVLFGQLADQMPARKLLVTLVSFQVLSSASFVFIHSYGVFVAVACIQATLDRGSSAVRNAWLGTILDPEVRVRQRAFLRAVNNVAIGAGATLAAVAVAEDTRLAYAALFLADSVTFAAVAILTARTGMRNYAHERDKDRSPGWLAAWRDGPYVAVTVLNAVMCVQFGLLEVGVPLWISQDTAAPRALVGAVLIANTTGVAVGQVRVSRRVASVRDGARACRWAGIALAGACVLYGLAHGQPAWAAVLLLLAGSATQTCGEVFSSAAAWSLSYELADPRSIGSYQGLFSGGNALAVMLTPMLVATTALRWHLGGWLLLAVMFAVAGALFVPVCTLADNRRVKGLLLQPEPAAGVPAGAGCGGEA
ncbi:MAG: MFS transporter [Trebonia sp.]